MCFCKADKRIITVTVSECKCLLCFIGTFMSDKTNYSMKLRWRIPTSRREISWLWTSIAKDLNQGLWYLEQMVVRVGLKLGISRFQVWYPNYHTWPHCFLLFASLLVIHNWQRSYSGTKTWHSKKLKIVLVTVMIFITMKARKRINILKNVAKSSARRTGQGS